MLYYCGRGLAWLDTGSPEGLLKASEFVSIVQERQGLYISCIEEIAWRKGFIDSTQLLKLGEELKNTEYGKYLINLAENVVVGEAEEQIEVQKQEYKNLVK